jgi:hypothetical protein
MLIGAPVIGLNDSGGARIQEVVHTYHSFDCVVLLLFLSWTHLSRRSSNLHRPTIIQLTLCDAHLRSACVYVCVLFLFLRLGSRITGWVRGCVSA